MYSLEFGDHTLLAPDFLLEKFEDGRMNLPRQEGKQRGPKGHKLSLGLRNLWRARPVLFLSKPLSPKRPEKVTQQRNICVG